MDVCVVEPMIDCIIHDNKLKSSRHPWLKSEVQGTSLQNPELRPLCLQKGYSVKIEQIEARPKKQTHSCRSWYPHVLGLQGPSSQQR